MFDETIRSTSKPLLYAVAARTRFTFLCVSRYRIQSKKLIDLILLFISDISPSLSFFAREAFFPDPISRYSSLAARTANFSQKQELDDAGKRTKNAVQTTIVSALKGSEGNSRARALDRSSLGIINLRRLSFSTRAQRFSSRKRTPISCLTSCSVRRSG